MIVEPVPRRWFEQAVVTPYDLVAESRAGADDGRLFLADGRRVPDVRLAEGGHLRAGAVAAEIEGVLRDVEHPLTAALRGSTRSTGTGWASLTRATGTSRLGWTAGGWRRRRRPGTGRVRDPARRPRRSKHGWTTAWAGRPYGRRRTGSRTAGGRSASR